VSINNSVEEVLEEKFKRYEYVHDSFKPFMNQEIMQEMFDKKADVEMVHFLTKVKASE
jgi:hypothetical protein